MASMLENTIRKTVTQGVNALHRFNRDRMAAPQRPNPYLSGPNRPLQREFTLAHPVVRGHIPPQLDGCYARIGPNPLVKVNPANHHWFLGDGMVHGVRLQGGQALWYRNRWIRSTQVSQALGEPPKPGPRHGSDTVNTNVMSIAGKAWALVEAGAWPVQLDEVLDTVAHDPFGGSLKVRSRRTRTWTPPPARCTRSATTRPTRTGCTMWWWARTAACSARSRSPWCTGPACTTA